MYPTFEEIIEGTRLAKKWRTEEAFEIAQNMVNLGLPFETVVSATRIDPEKVKELYQGTVSSE